MKHVAACSFGKDSVATVILAKEHNEPLDEVVYCEVMFDDQISGEVPEHRDFIYEIAKPIFESWGIKVTILRSQKTYLSNFMHVITKGEQAGKIRAFPLCGRCTIQRDCKLPPMEKYKKQLGGNNITPPRAGGQRRYSRDKRRAEAGVHRTAAGDIALAP